MIQLQANWSGNALHVWATRVGAVVTSNASGDDAAVSASVDSVTVRGDALRNLIGDVWDSLLVQEGSDGRLTLSLPFDSRGLYLGPKKRDASGDAAPSAAQDAAREITFRATDIETISFSVSDAVDFLTSPRSTPRASFTFADSFLYWQRAALFVRELLARQRYVPTIDRLSGDRFRAYWRVVLDEESDKARLQSLINAMPPVCRAFVPTVADADASALLERFLWRAVDALVRRCLEGDESAHVLLEQPASEASNSVLWLRALVSSDGMLEGDSPKQAIAHTAITSWLAKLDPPAPQRTCRTCLRLQAPETDNNGITAPDATWQLTVHAQAIRRPRLILDADELLRRTRDDEPRVLPRPFDNAIEQVRRDLAWAVRYVPALQPCATPDGPLACSLSIEEAYAFLRDALPILEAEGFVVWSPDWWQGSRPKLRMALDLRPTRASGDTPSRMSIESLIDYDWRVAVGDEELTVEELTELARSKAPLVKLRGSWAEVRPAEIRQALAFLQEHPGGQITMFEALRLCYAADDLETGLPVTGIHAHGWVEQMLAGEPDETAIEFEDQPEAFQGELRPYQLKGMAWLRFLSRLGMGACLADDMGLGKTIQLIALLLCERANDPPPGPTLLVVPTSLVGNWQRELAKFAPSIRVMIHHGLERLTGDQFIQEVGRVDVVISTYSLTHRDFEHISAINWHRVALDEAQNIKNPVAKQTRAIRSLTAIQRVALTGTPVENRLSELWSILDFLNPGYLGTATDFRRRFAVPIERYNDADRTQRLRHLIRPFVLRRLKSDPTIEADLPAKMEMKVFCNLSREQAGLYEAVVGDMLSQIDQSEGIQRKGLILKTLVRLKQICNHPSQVLKDGGALAHRSGKCDRLTEMLEEVIAEGDCALVFTQFRVMGELLKQLLDDTLGEKTLFLHGGTPRLKRDEMVERFQARTGETPVFILSLKAGGFGLNLTAATHVFHFDRWWNPAVEDQATDRTHRVGQSRRVQVHKFVCAGTLEEKIDRILTQKRALAQHIVGTGEEWLTEMSTPQLCDMFALARDAVAEN